jgi:hypothetical protein
MRSIIIIFVFLFSVFSILIADDKSTMRDSSFDKGHIDSLYGADTWSTYFEKKTLNNAFIKLQLIDDFHYVVKWGIDNVTMFSPDTFLLDGNESRLPKFVAKGDDYILLRQGCGSPCWIGYFLGLSEKMKFVPVNEYIAYDLNNNLVAFIDSDSSSSISVMEITTGKSSTYKISGCNSAFLGYCIRSAKLVNDKLIIRMVDSDNSNQKKARRISIKLKNNSR